MSILKKNNSKGFTLVELLVVIAIIGVLATLILLQLGIARAKARDAKRIADVNQIRTGVELYFDDRGGSYPGDALCPTAVGDVCEVNDPVTPDWSGNDLTPYLSARVLPKDPLSGVDYDYAYWPLDVDAKKARYHVYSNLERLNAPALTGDTDIDSSDVLTWGGTGIDAGVVASEACDDDPATADCIYDLGQQ